MRFFLAPKNPCVPSRAAVLWHGLRLLLPTPLRAATAQSGGLHGCTSRRTGAATQAAGSKHGDSGEGENKGLTQLTATTIYHDLPWSYDEL